MKKVTQKIEYTCDFCNGPITNGDYKNNNITYHKNPLFITTLTVCSRSGSNFDLHKRCFEQIVRESTKTSDTD